MTMVGVPEMCLVFHGQTGPNIPWPQSKKFTSNNNTMVAALEVNLTHVLYAWILVVGMLVAAILFLPPLIVPAKIDEPKRREEKKAE